MVTAQLTCAFDFAYAKSRFSHDVAYVLFIICENIRCIFIKDKIPLTESDAEEEVRCVFDDNYGIILFISLFL